MFERAAGKRRKVENPATAFARPHDIVKDRELTSSEKKEALATWEQDARQMLTASNEGMAGPDEGVKAEDHHRLGEVVRAKNDIGEKPAQKPSH